MKQFKETLLSPNNLKLRDLINSCDIHTRITVV
jgi:hypothetical protein